MAAQAFSGERMMVQVENQSSTPIVLLIEDDLPTLELYRRTLSQEHQVVGCSDERSARETLHTHKLRAVVLEPAMDGGKGWTLLSLIKSTPSSRSVPVILCSVLNERKRGLEMGAITCLVKPVLPTTLLETLRRVL